LDEVSIRLQQLLPGDAFSAGAVVALAGLCLVAATWKATTAALCVALTGDRRTILIKSCLNGTLFLLLIIGGGWLSRRLALLEQVEIALDSLLALAGAVKLVSTIRSFAIAAWRPLLSPRALVALTSIWLVTAALFSAFAVLLWTETNLPKTLILLALVWLWPADELFRSVINLAGNRHR